MPYLSPSRMSLFNTCELAFKLKYLDGDQWKDETTDWYAAYGSLMHTIFEWIGKKEITTFDAIRHYNDYYSSCGIPEQSSPKYYEAGINAIRAKFEELSLMSILGIEIEYNVPVDFSIPPLYGFIDIAYRDEHGVVLRDYKSSNVYTNSIMSKQMQPPVYALAFYKLTGEWPYKFEFDFFRFKEIKSILIDDAFKQMAEIKVKAWWNKVCKSEFAASYNPFFCNNFCEKRSICPVYQLKVNS
jgi:hypothetical protein